MLPWRMPTRSEILAVLQDPERHADRLFASARQARQEMFGDKVFLYGFLYASSYCANNCHFCLSRRENRAVRRYRKNPSEIVEYAARLADSGAHLIDVASGEDAAASVADLESLFRRIREQTGLPVMASIGVLDGARAALLEHVDWYACYQETHNRTLFARLRPDQDFDRRFNSKVMARQNGVLVEEGLLTGVAERSEDIADSMDAMAALRADQVRVMSFVPQPGTPLQDLAPPPSIRELAIIALLRLVFPDRLIPASLDVAGLAGLQQRLDAGANVITSIVPPGAGLAGVANQSLDIDNGGRSIAAIQPVLARCNLRAASPEDYRAWLARRKVAPC